VTWRDESSISRILDHHVTGAGRHRHNGDLTRRASNAGEKYAVAIGKQPRAVKHLSGSRFQHLLWRPSSRRDPMNGVAVAEKHRPVGTP
jgi:hypothetical protein